MLKAAEFVTGSMKNGLIAYTQVLKKAGLNYLKCCSSPMTGIMSTNFSHIIQQFLTLKTIPIQVTKNKVSNLFR